MKSLKYLILSILAILIGIGIYYSVNKKPIDKKVPVAAACSKENEKESVSGCCAGLKSTIDDKEMINGLNGYCPTEFIYPPGGLGGGPYSYCIKCGDGICGEHEGKCSCSEDCGKPEPSQQKTRDEFSLNGLMVVTLNNNNSTYNLNLDTPFLLQLGADKDWTVTIENPDLLSLSDGPVDTKSQGIYLPIKSGETVLTAVGDPPCRKSKPQCQIPSTLFKLKINVSNNSIPTSENISQIFTKILNKQYNGYYGSIVNTTGTVVVGLPVEHDPEGIFLKDETAQIWLDMWDLHRKDLIGKKIEVLGIAENGQQQIRVLWYKIK